MPVAALLFLATRFNWAGWWRVTAAAGVRHHLRPALQRKTTINCPPLKVSRFRFCGACSAWCCCWKLGLFPRISTFAGFAPAMPAFISAVCLLLWLLPKLLENKFAFPPVFLRVTVLLVLLIGFGSLFLQSKRFYDSENLPVGQGGDRIIAFGPEGNSVEARTTGAALAWIETNVPPDATIAALPEGVIVNYLSRRDQSDTVPRLEPDHVRRFQPGKNDRRLRKKSAGLHCDRGMEDLRIWHRLFRAASRLRCGFRCNGLAKITRRRHCSAANRSKKDCSE